MIDLSAFRVLAEQSGCAPAPSFVAPATSPAETVAAVVRRLDDHPEFTERAAIREYDGDCPRPAAELLSLAEVLTADPEWPVFLAIEAPAALETLPGAIAGGLETEAGLRTVARLLKLRR